MNESAVIEAPHSIAPATLDHISFSSIKTYQTCPRKFAFKYIEHEPEKFKPSSSYGTIERRNDKTGLVRWPRRQTEHGRGVPDRAIDDVRPRSPAASTSAGLVRTHAGHK